jgi:uncharacterized membrane protein
MGAKLGQVHVPPPVVVTATETKVVLAGVASLKVAVVQLLGPLLVMVCVYVIVFPAVAGLGDPLFVTVRSHTSATVVVTVVLLLAEVGSLVDDVTEEFPVIVPAAIVGATFTTTAMSAVAPAARELESVHVTEVVTVQDQPTGADTETNVVFVGIGSVKLAPVAAAGPLFVTVCV